MNSIAERPRNFNEGVDVINEFSPKLLESLEMDAYLELISSYPNKEYFLTHVTRQGIRDHAQSMWHQAGKGNFHDGFLNILDNDKSLKSSIKDENMEEIIYKILKSSYKCDSRTSAINTIKSFMSESDAGGYHDYSTVHFAADYVDHESYGSESGNEIFFVFPIDFIASNYKYSGSIKPWSDKTSNHNDVWVSGDDGSISLDCGIVFIPKNQDVDPETGSIYETIGKVAIYNDEEDEQAQEKPIRPLKTIKSQEYWEKYFQENPNKKPKHIIWYDGEPNDAVEELKNDLLSRNNNDHRINLDIDKNNTQRGSEDAMHSDQEFLQASMKIVDNIFPVLKEEEIEKILTDYISGSIRDEAVVLNFVNDLDSYRNINISILKKLVEFLYWNKKIYNHPENTENIIVFIENHLESFDNEAKQNYKNIINELIDEKLRETFKERDNIFG